MNERVNKATEGESIARTYRTAKTSLMRHRLIELSIWTGIALFVSAKALIRFVLNLFGGESLWQVASSIARYNAGVLLFSAFIALLPIFVFQIFGDLPFPLLRRRLLAASQFRQFRVNTAAGSVSIDTVSLNDPASVADAIETGLSIEAARCLGPRDLLALYAERTSDLTRRIYARAGIYLLAGVTVSFVGLAFFYNGSRDLPASTDHVDHILGFVPGLAILFFIEFIAFFFLRQYRAAMDDFRYFDRVRRSREDNLIILKMFAEDPGAVPTKDIVAAMNIHSPASRPGKAAADSLASRPL